MEDLTIPFNQMLRRYAELVVLRGVNLQVGQEVYISSEPIHREFIRALVKSCYEHGAKYVHVQFKDPYVSRARVEYGVKEDLTFVPEFFVKQHDDILAGKHALIRVLGMEDPEILEGLDPQLTNLMQQAERKAIKHFVDEGISGFAVHWTIVAAATPKWASRVFPELPEKEACEALWNDIFRITRVDSDDYLNEWSKHSQRLLCRADSLNKLGIQKLHFVGPGTDLSVGLHERALFKGGAEISGRRIAFDPNIPTEEVYTSPDWRTVTGDVRVTRPVMIYGVMVEGIKLQFKHGELVSCDATKGLDMLKAFVGADCGAKRLGEVALVGIDSPIYQTGRVYEEILFDENAACHIALGGSFSVCIAGGEEMAAPEREACGLNDSAVHLDLMISSEEVDVVATTKAGEEIALLHKGAWMPELQ